MKKLIKITTRFFLAVLALFIVLMLTIQLPPVQNWLAKLATDRLSNDLHTEVRIKNISFSLFDKLNLEGLLVKDQQKDTLLYAGVLRVRITDWFFVRKNIDLKYIALEDAIINLNRSTPIWNYNYIIEHFSSSDTANKKKSNIVLSLRKIDLKNITFTKNDKWRGEIITAKIGGLLIDADSVDLKKSKFSISDVILDKPQVSLVELNALRPDSIKKKEDLADMKNKGLNFNPGIQLEIASIKINNGSFSLQTDNDLPKTYFDAAHLKLTQLNGNIKKIQFNKDTLIAKMDIGCKERCGFEIKKLKTNLRITPQIIELAKLDLKTNKSHLGDYYAMRFRHFDNDFKQYVTAVVMDGRFKESKVYSDDIAFFAPALKPWKKESLITGSFLGTVANFQIKNLFLRSGGSTNISGDFAMKGLPDIDKTTIDFPNGTVKTNSQDLAIYIPALKNVNNPNLAALGTIFFRGGFHGTIKDFKTKGVLSSNIGAIDADIAMKFPNNEEPTYSGSLISNRFNLGKFVNSGQLGLVDFNGQISGSSFDLTKINASINGVFNTLEFNGYAYSNITTNGNFLRNYFNGDVKVEDPNLDITSNVDIDLSKAEPRVKIVGDLHESNFKNLKLTNDNVELRGLLDLNFTGRDIDDFRGTAKIVNATLLDEKNQLNFDTLSLATQISPNGEKKLTLSSNEFKLVVSGENYRLLDLPNTFQMYLSHYYPSYFAPPTSVGANQDFKFSLYTKDFDNYAKILDRRLGGLDNATIEGSINTSKNEFGIEASIPNFRFGKYKFSGASIVGHGNLDSLKIASEIASIRVGDSLNFPNTTLDIVSSNDYSSVKLHTKADNTLNEASINVGVTTMEDGLRINFNPSYFVVNEKKWDLEKSGEINIRRNLVSADNVKFTQGLQEIKVETQNDNNTDNTNNLIIKLKDIVVGDMTSLFMKNPQLEGLANGEIDLNDFYGAFKAEAKIKTEQFRLNNDSIGTLDVNAGFDSKTGKVDFKAKSPNQHYSFNTEGYYNTKDTTAKALYVNTQLSDTKIRLVQQFVGDVFSDLDGTATGNLIVRGNPSLPSLAGKVTVTNARLKVNYTQVTYTIDSATVDFQDDGIDFGQFTVKDRYKNKGTVKGKLYEKNFKDLAFDFTLTTNKLLMIDTKPKDNKQFYGKAIGKATLAFKGPETSAYLKVVAEANDSSHIYIPNSINRENGDADFIVFKKYGTEMIAEAKKTDFDITVDLDLTANNFVKIDVILDELSGDVIKAVGDGRLKIVAGTSVPLSMKGRYNIESGSYNFNFQSFIRKPFELLADAGNFIEWTGDPMKADIHIDAQYTAERVSVSDLISSQQATVNSSTKSYRGEVYVIASLRDKLSRPTITFRLDFPQSSPVKTDAVFTEFINRIESDQNEMLSQATSLIVFGSFAPYGQGLLAGGSSSSTNVNSIGVNTISQLVTKQVNKALSNLLYKITGDKSLRFDLGTSVYSSSSILDQSTGLTATSSSNRLDRTNINVKVGRSFFNDNVIVSFGGDLDFNVGTTSSVANGNFQWLPDLNIEFVLTQDRRLRGIVFSKNSLDITGSTLGRINRQGVSLSYRRDFDRLFALKPKEPKVNVEDSNTNNTN